MSNTYFQFKQFTVHQEKSALKVSTDSCVFGAWVAEKLASLPSHPRLLDIGAGTGLLMLMVAQQCDARIDGIEIDLNSAEQAVENLAASPWEKRLHIIQGDAKSFEPAVPYDLIFSNPPFFEGDLTSGLHHKNLAKHDAGLTLDAWMQAAIRCVSPQGALAVLLPYHRMDYFTKLAAVQGLVPVRRLLMKQTPAHDYFRVCLWLEKNNNTACVDETLCIRLADGSYSAEMNGLLLPYYLYL